ncbi:hypothetical protein PHYBLDRAFT_158491 [Phycomyces blakesleeanus NRRL 1555(-)]|uniref:Uncharacterized protein n=2 Tax=Phycomyces blakesleeanus TaxID=4837 RepID=A0A162PW88_PHYB8|nr:hypothetical protein PHYBLDRAFT_158491 [Phycomyces blakesleeanus NRRL 1555(-)]OAD74706.1 hypothetical protein PHYBLDRAFT_158491 [Phycomyces blakesleeanus NRRL 1555(-)]|eukprot:XP_018292746.1 hypothetical protein PHYBLDRAFT_158491 [Phycomyces blakesleeanus NRRL 1555(-)]
MTDEKINQDLQNDTTNILRKPSNGLDLIDWEAQHEKSDSTDEPNQTPSDQSRASTPTDSEPVKTEDMLGGDDMPLLPLATCLEPTNVIPVRDIENSISPPQNTVKSEEKPVESVATPPEAQDKKLLLFQIETTKFGKQDLVLYENRDPIVDVKEYCEKYEMSDHFDKILEAVLESYTRKKTRRILGKKKKSKTIST